MDKTTSTAKKKNIRKCLYCGKDIDISIDDYCMASTRRYAHTECYHKNYKSDDEYITKIYSMLKEEVRITVDFPQCERQRNSFILKLGYTNEGIYKALKYFYLVTKHSPDKSGNRIGIVPYVYEEANNYYANIEKQQKLLTKQINHQQELEKPIIKVNLPKNDIKKDYINLDEIEG